MQIDWWTLALQAVNFLVLVWLLWRFLYRPVREVIEKRKQLAEQAFADADKQKSEAEAARQRFEEGRVGLAQERQDMLKKIHEESEVDRRNVLEEARDKADELLEAARESIGDRPALLKIDALQRCCQIESHHRRGVAHRKLGDQREGLGVGLVLEAIRRTLEAAFHV